MPSATGPFQSSAGTFVRTVFADGVDSFALIEALVSNSAEENEWREFKEASWFGASGIPEDIRKQHDDTLKKYWSENLSAFANSGGGVLIWGIAAPNGIAEKLSLPKDVQGLARRLRELQMNAVEPPVAEAEVRVAQKVGSDEGFVVCYIPNSAFSPHCANWAVGGYYIRGHDSNARMRPEVLRRMFYPQIGPLLIPVARLTVSKGEDLRFHAAIQVEIRNDGSGSAKETFIDLRIRSDRVYDHHPNNRLWRERYNTPGSGYVCIITIHPRETVLFMRGLSHAGAYESSDMLNGPIECTFWIFAENAESIVAEVKFEAAEIQEALHSKTPLNKDAKVQPFRSAT